MSILRDYRSGWHRVNHANLEFQSQSAVYLRRLDFHHVRSIPETLNAKPDTR